MQKNNYNANKIVETGIMISITFVIIAMTAYVPILLELGMFILPIPATLIYIRHDFKLAFITVVLSITLTAFLYNPISAIVSGVVYGFAALSLGYYIKNNKSSSETIVAVRIATAIGKIIKFLIYAIFVSKSGIVQYLNVMVKQLHESLDAYKNMYIKMNAPKEAIEYIDSVSKYVNLEMLILILTLTFIIGGLIQAYISYFIIQKILFRLNYVIEEIIPFSRVYIPNKIEALLIITACIGIILNAKGFTKYSYAFSIVNALIIFTLNLNGMAYLVYLLKEKGKLPKGIIIITVLLILFIPALSDLYLVFGITDIIFNLRKLDPNPIRKVKSRE